MIKEVVMQGLHINNTANTKVRGKGGGLLHLPTGLRTNLICFWFITFQQWAQTILGITSLTNKDRGEEGMKYLSLFLVLVGNIPPRIQ